MLTLSDVLKKINEGWDDFASIPAVGANDRGAFEDYPLHKLASCGDVEGAAVLIDSGANVDASGEDLDTPLHRAVAAGDENMIQLLIARGADVNKINMYGNSPKNDAVGTSAERLFFGVPLS